MFKLKKVELLGFKSFADRTRLEFATGIAAIVGPNGCGKSNLSDAVNWVLGEQSPRTLRGERMSDLIFNGTNLRPPTGMAEVSVTLVEPEAADADEQPRKSPTARPAGLDSLDLEEDATAMDRAVEAGDNGHGAVPPSNGDRPSPLRLRAGEITVTRRLFRSGESEYLINGETCRLRDIQDLFMGTGLGPESYAIIEQGRIGQILSSKPSDRRAIIEEAAGVSKFKTRKRLAEAKLESSRLNLSRITDILDEVTRQVNSLKRQASKARRYRELQGQERAKQRVVVLSRLIALEAECARLRQEVSQAQASCTEAAQELEALEREEKAARRQYEELEMQVKSRREAAAERGLERERLISRADFVRQHSADLEARAAESARESEQLEQQRRLFEDEVAGHARAAEQVRSDWAVARETAACLTARQEELSSRLTQAEVEAESCRQALLVAVSRAAELRNQLVKAEEISLALERQLARTEAERSGVEEEYRRISSELEAFGSEHEREQGLLSDLSHALAETRAGLGEARQDEALRRQELDALRQEFSAASARKQALEESLARHAYSTETVRRLLSANISSNGHHFRPLGVLADFVEVSPGYEEVLEEFLKDELEYVVVAGHDEARCGIALLKSEGSGRSTFFLTQLPPHPHSGIHAEVSSGAEGTSAVASAPGVLARVCDLVRFEPRLGLNGDPAFRALALAYLVQDAATAEQLAVTHPDCHFLTPTGEHYHHRLVSGGKGPSAGPLALRRDFRELERRTVRLESAVGTAEVELKAVTERAAQLEAESTRLANARLEAEKKAVLSNEKLRQLRAASDRGVEQLSVLNRETQSLGEERDSALGCVASFRNELEAAEVERSRREEGIANATSLVRDLRAQLDALAPELTEAQTRSSALEERARSGEAEHSRLLARAQEVRARLEHVAEQFSGWNEEQRGLAEEGSEITGRLAEVEAEQQAAAEKLQILDQESRAAHAHSEELATRIEAARAELEARRERRSAIDVAMARRESEYSHATGLCREELRAEPAALLAEFPAESALAGEAFDAAEVELRELKTKIEGLGAVNMMALEELQEAEERFSFLETQRQDLLASIHDMEQAIREIDLVSRRQFVEAFTAINGYFAESFRTLFGGGHGQMRLTDENDPESGVDMVAQPPGKRLQNVLLLSGGEKALTALALLIALFRYTPSPFCILDEVDAPLDEANIDRFARMIGEMSRHTQFILITHNKRTMEIAKLLYGVTMQEPGVSKLVSVRFDEVERQALAAVG